MAQFAHHDVRPGVETDLGDRPTSGQVRSTLHLIHDRAFGHSAPRRGEDVSGHVTVGPTQARRGAIIPVRVAKGKPCPACATRTDETAAQSCATCEGEGRLIQWQHNHRVRLPSGIEDGQKIRLRERGAPGTDGGAPGDLYVTVHVTS
ncbi:DnaJ C-terminal domain-containing protein [Streptomyces californicus]|uniref:DnaJ C-terminal domain-containing protein n=1 Tax=Streptomyces californicus TaxID=67351 RepID=UPI00296FE5CD|nr:DnaJ C-terminal domain-containing protein [Streptomyces californicus]MDW4903191.1 DnaJ C-terminal domain-containing protein [Streptomyces californicus]